MLILRSDIMSQYGVCRKLRVLWPVIPVGVDGSCCVKKYGFVHMSIILLIMLGLMTTGCGDTTDSTESSTGSSKSEISLITSSNSIASGDSVILTATVTPSDVTGVVLFYDGSSFVVSKILSAGLATCTVSMEAGTHTIKVIYNGSSKYDSCSDTVTVTVSSSAASTESSISLIASSTSVTSGDSVTLTAAVTPAEVTGTVNFYDGSAYLGSGTINSGEASFTTNSLSVGSHALTAVYGGSSTCSSSSSDSVTVTVTTSTTSTANITSLAAFSTLVSYGTSITLHATLSPLAITDTLTFYNGSTSQRERTLSSGKAIFSVSSLSIG
jgi:hypothetical protein